MIYSKDLKKTAIIAGSSKTDYSELLLKINVFSRSYEGRGFKKIAIYSENRPEWIYAFYSALVNRACVVTVDYMASGEDVSYILEDSRPELVFSSANMKDKLLSIIKTASYQPEIIFFEDMNEKSQAEAIPVDPPQDTEETAVIIYTSGTTGSPKGVMLSYKNLIANLDGVSKDVKIFRPGKQTLMLLPLHHIFPLAGSMMAPLYSGGTVVISPSMQSADIIETLKNNEVNIMIGVPRLYDLLYRGIKDKIDAKLLSRILYKVVAALRSRLLGKKIFKKVHKGLGGHLETMVSGGAALGKDAGGFFYSLGFDVLEGFGMTEAAPMITFTRPENIKIGSAGQALPGTEIKIVDGEITARGKNIMKGYYNRSEETAEVLKDGWLYTGDLGRLDSDGCLYITGRKKEIIILSNGKNINPTELELKLEKMSPFIKEAGVFLEKDSLHALIVPDLSAMSSDNIKSPADHFKNNVISELNKTLSSYKRIMKFTILKNELPRTRLGKLQRHKLSEYAVQSLKKPDRSGEFESEEFRTVKLFLKSSLDADASFDDHIEFDLGIDSLGKISLISFIENTFGIKIEEEKLSAFQSIGKITDYIKEHKSKHKAEIVEWSSILKEKIANIELPKSWFTQNMIKTLSKWFFNIYLRFRAEGVENIPEGPVIIAPNHQSYLDGLFVAANIKRQKMKDTYFYAKKKHVNNRFLRFFADRNNVIVMDLKKDLKASIIKLAEVLKMKKNLIIFPEGTRSKNGELGEFKKTFAILSKELGIPVVPVAIVGADSALSGGSFFLKPFKRVKVEYLEPVYPNEECTPDTIAERVRQAISSRLEKK
ncbi:MAG: AMP-binding protein [Candidatus Delongbacteria bacterium]|nr:AMP-binding protein [Candidatus Delongbacteria bacterium]